MEDAVPYELKLGGLMRDDVRRELDVLRTHFESVLDLIKRKENEAMEAIRVREEAAKAREEKELKSFEDIRKAKMKEMEEERKRVEKLVAEKEKGMNELKMGKERMGVELREKEKEVNGMKKVVDDLMRRVQDNASLNDTCRRLSDENFELREEVKLLRQQLEHNAQPPGREEQLSAIQRFLQILSSAGIITICDTVKPLDADVSGESGDGLFKLVKEHIDDHEVATSKVIAVLLNAKDKAQDLVLEALRISYIAEVGYQSSESRYRPCRILLLEQLSHVCPQAISQARDEACRVALEWIANVENSADNILEISRLLQFLSAFDIASEFKDEVLVPMLYNAAIHEGTPDLIITLGLANRIAGHIKTLLQNGQRLKALQYISAFKLEKRFSVGKIVHEEMNHIKQTCQSKLKEGGHGQAAEVINFEIDSLKELIKGIKVLECQANYTAVNLEQRLVKLEKKKHFKKRCANNPSPSSDLEPSRNKRCKLPGTPRLKETDPTDTINVHPDTGCRDSDPELLTMEEHKLTGTAKSTEVSPKDTFNLGPESGSMDSCCSNPTGDPTTSRKEECQIPGTAQAVESTSKDTLDVRPENKSMTLVCCSNPNSDSKPSRNEECEFPGTAQPIGSASNGTSNFLAESGLRVLCCSNPSSHPKEPKSGRKKRSKLPRTSESAKVVTKDTSNPESGSISLRSCSPGSKCKLLNKNGSKFPRTAKSVDSKKHASNAFSEIGSRNALHSQEMLRAPFPFQPMQFQYGAVSPYIFPSQQPAWYEPQELPPPPEYFHPYPPFEGHPEASTWHHQQPDEHPYFDWWP